MKKLSVLAAAALLTAVIVPTLTGCKPNAKTATGPIWDYFEAQTLEENEVLVKAEGGKVRIRWGGRSGASKYEIYRSPSRFGQYEKVATLSADTLSYETDENIYDYYKVEALVGCVLGPLGEPQSAFSPNTLIASPSDDMEAVQAYIDEAHAELELGSTGQFSSKRVALMFLPGNYPEITARVGYYTSVNGLGETPKDVTLGGVYVSNKVLSDQNSTCTFWRSVENVTVNSSVTWSVSQATSMRRTKIQGNLSLSYGGWASGGYLANSLVTGRVYGSTQQQWYSRNSQWQDFEGGSFNMVFTGCEGNIPSTVWTETSGSATSLVTTEKVAEKPFLYELNGEYRVFVPDVQENTRGITWENGMGEEIGYDYSLSKFYIADARYDDDVSLNAALKAGKYLLLTPGNYELNAPLEITKMDTVVLGIGYATLKISDSNRDAAIKVADVDGVRIADVLVDAGYFSKNMVVIGTEGSSTSHKDNPVVLSNLYLRIGGVENVHTETDTALVIHSNDTIGDHFWLWRADHSRGVAWDDTVNDDGSISYGNPAKTGIEVNGDFVRCYALMVEHFEDYQTYWKGEYGLTVMYQSETPYRTPSQDAWTSHDGTKSGCASYKVADSVTNHRAYGIGIYLVSYTPMTLASAIEVPEKSGIMMEHLVICAFSTYNGISTITNVINDYGGGVDASTFRKNVVKYPLG